MSNNTPTPDPVKLPELAASLDQRVLELSTVSASTDDELAGMIRGLNTAFCLLCFAIGARQPEVVASLNERIGERVRQIRPGTSKVDDVTRETLLQISRTIE